MTYLFPFIRDLAGLPRYRQALKKAARTWQPLMEVFEFAAPYPSILGRPRKRQLLRLLPPKLSSPRGWTIYLHGGAWTFGRPHDFIAAAQPWIEEGFGVLLPTHRRLPRYVATDMLEDLQLAMAFVHQQGWLKAEQEVQLAGMSSGGHLAALLALSPQLWAEAGWSKPTKVICCGAPLDLDVFPKNAALRRLRGPINAPSYQATNPHHLLKSAVDIPPFLLIHPKKDGLAPADQAAAFFQSLQSRSPQSSMLWLEDEGHLGAGRWMFEEGSVREAIRNFITADSAIGFRPSE